jgi:hypothetical protein
VVIPVLSVKFPVGSQVVSFSVPQPIPLRSAGKPQIPPVGPTLPGTMTQAGLLFVIVIALALPDAIKAAAPNTAPQSAEWSNILFSSMNCLP